MGMLATSRLEIPMYDFARKRCIFLSAIKYEVEHSSEEKASAEFFLFHPIFSHFSINRDISNILSFDVCARPFTRTTMPSSFSARPGQPLGRCKKNGAISLTWARPTTTVRFLVKAQNSVKFRVVTCLWPRGASPPLAPGRFGWLLDPLDTIQKESGLKQRVRAHAPP